MPSHATAATFRIDLANEAAQREALETMIVPGVRSAPGVVSGTWTLDRDRAESLVVITYESPARRPRPWLPTSGGTRRTNGPRVWS